jgi:hypothetical protein
MCQGGGLQKGRSLCLALGYQVCDVTKKNFRTHQGRDQESSLVKQSKGNIEIVHNPDMGAGTSDNRQNECSNIRVFMVKK